MAEKEYKIAGLTIIVSDSMVEDGPPIIKKNPWWVWLFTGERVKKTPTKVPSKCCFVSGTYVYVHPTQFEKLRNELNSH